MNLAKKLPPVASERGPFVMQSDAYLTKLT